MMNVRGIILAGGSSRRMGKNKLLMELEGKPIINWVVENVVSSKLNDILLVYGEYDIKTDIKKVYNSLHEEGMSTSIKAGLRGFKGDGVMLILGDMPYVSCAIINKIVEAFESSNKSIIVPLHNGKKGNPVLIGCKYFEHLMNNKGDKGAREIIANNQDDILWVEVDHDGIFIDIDDEKSYTQYKSCGVSNETL